MPSHETHMHEALALAQAAAAQQEVPVGAVCVADGKIVGRGYNRCIARSDPSAHAEIIALRDAASGRQNYRLPDISLYVTLEPCAMCLGAMYHARVRHLIFAAHDPKTGAAGGLFDLSTMGLPHRMEISSGVLAEPAAQLLRSFFKSRRSAGQ